MISGAQTLMSMPVADLEQGVRLGDVYALLIDHFVGQNAYPQAYSLLRSMTQAGVDVGPYVDEV